MPDSDTCRELLAEEPGPGVLLLEGGAVPPVETEITTKYEKKANTVSSWKLVFLSCCIDAASNMRTHRIRWNMRGVRLS
jgi:hypothetical protein